MFSRLLLQIPIFAALVFPPSLAALDTLRVGLNGNISWTGRSFGAPVEVIVPEYKVSATFTDVGNVPGNLIDLKHLDGITPAVLVKAVVDAQSGLQAGQQALVKQQLMDVVSPLSGIARLDTFSRGTLSTLLILLEPGQDLGLATQRVQEAVDALLPDPLSEGGADDGQGAQSALDCRTENQEFASTATVAEGWGDCQTALGGTRGFTTECYRTTCTDRKSGEITTYPGKARGKYSMETPGERAGKGLQAADQLPSGTLVSIIPVALGPDHVAEGENVAQRALGWSGTITAPAITDVSRSELEVVLRELIEPGGVEDAFQRKGTQGALGTFIVLDLGSPIGVNRVRFYPRNTVQRSPNYPFQNDFLRQFELLVHNGNNLVLDGTGRLVPQLQDFEVLLRSTENQQAVVDVPVAPARLVRFVRVKSISSFPYEIDEFEVFGQGFISKSRYISPVYDLGSPATWGNISWIERFVDLRRGGAEGAGSEEGDCQVETRVFDSAAEVPETWGGCETVSRYEDGVGYRTVWQCYQTRCRDASTGQQTTTAGRRRGKVVAPAQAGISGSSSESQIIVRTRTGSDPTPLLYKRKNVQRPREEEQTTSLVDPSRQLDRAEYLGLVPQLEASPPFVWDKGAIEDDLEKWSPWSAPYRNGNAPGGTPILSPGPRRYIQFSIDFENSVIDATKLLEQLSIEYLLPPIADDLIAEIFPRQVEAFETVQFVYAVRALMNIPGVKGFDTFEISTPARVLGIDRIEIWDEAGALVSSGELNADIGTEGGVPFVQLADGSRHALPYAIRSATGETFAIQAVGEDHFIVQFPPISRPPAGGQRLLKVSFRSRVLLYSTLFKGKASFSTESGSIQRITPGNAAELGEGDVSTASGITVLSPAINQGSLVGSFAVRPNPFTPNGDGINDVLAIEYDILAITRAARVSVQIFDLSGRLVRQLYKGEDLSGHYDRSAIPGLAWDGTNAGGERVAPGLYLLRIAVEGDARENAQVRPIAVAY